MSTGTDVVVVLGTDTEVGKTWVSAQVARLLGAAGLAVSARKPVQSYDPGDRQTDAHVLAAATGEEHVAVCRLDRRYEVAMAPPMAATALGREPFTIAQLADELTWPTDPAPAVALVETAGGVLSPMAADGTPLDLVEALQPGFVVLVADAGLGTINAVRLAVGAIDRASHIATTIVMLNRFDGEDELHRRNLDWLTNVDGYDVVTSASWLARRLSPEPRSY